MASRLLRMVAFIVAMTSVPASVWAQVCAAPGKDGAVSASGVVNDYFIGPDALIAGADSMALGAPLGDGAGNSPSVGDLLLVIQMQDASINSSNSNAYGDGSGSGQGSTSVGNTGLYEFVTVTAENNGTVTFAPALGNTYRNAAATSTAGQKRYQVIRVPQYASATAQGVTAPAWDGSRGGVVAMDVRGTLTLGDSIVEGQDNRAIFAAGKGFRGAAGNYATSGGSRDNWAGTFASFPGDGGKGEGIAGTPLKLALSSAFGSKSTNSATISNLKLLTTTAEGYPGGSRGRGAPGNAGGGGNDGAGASSNINQNNSGGGGGGNYAAGGVGGRPWNLPLVDVSGRGGAGYMGTVGYGRVFMGGGGGAGATNNNTSDTGTYENNGISCNVAGLCSSGAAGGGIVILRARLINGGGVIDVRGGNGYNVQQDAAGGGGGGGSVVIYTTEGGSASVNASGGDGGNAWGSNTSGISERHGPGGGGGGGFIGFAPASFVLAGTINGGTPGRTSNGASDTYEASGNQGGIASFQPPSLPGTLPGADCSTDLHLSKTNGVDMVQSGQAVTYMLTATNLGAQASSGQITVADVLASGLYVQDGPVPTGGPQGANWSCSALGNVLTCTSATTIAGSGGTSSFSITVGVSATNGMAAVNKAKIGGGGDPNKPVPQANDVVACTANDQPAGCALDVDTVSSPLLSLSKTDNTDTVLAGSETVYQLTISNLGEQPSSGVIGVADKLPAGTVYNGTASSSDGGFSCAYDSFRHGILCTSSASYSLGSGMSVVISIPVTVSATAPGALINLAKVGGGNDPTKPNPADIAGAAACSSQSASDVVSGCAVDIDTVRRVALTLSKDDGQPYININGNTTYVFNVTNSGDYASQGVISFRDVLPSPMTWPATLVKAGANAGDWNCTRVGNTEVTCTSETSIPVGGVSVFSLQANAGAMTSGAQYLNKARIGGGGDPLLTSSTPSNAEVSACTSDNIPSGCAIDLDTAQSAPQIRLAKTHAGGSKNPGDTVTFTLTVSNTGGTTTASGTVRVIDVLPTGFSSLAAAATQGIFNCSTSGRNLTCNNTGGPLAANATAAITFTAVIASSATNPLLNSAQVGTNNTDPQNSTYPTTGTAGACTGNGVPYVGCAVDSVELDADPQITKAQKAGAAATGFQTTPLAVGVGSSVQFQIVVSNGGGAAISNVAFADVIPANFTSPALISATGAGGAVGCSAANVTLEGNKLGGTVSSLPKGASCTIVVQATASTAGANVVNTATVSVPAGVNDTNTGNNTASVSTTIQQPSITAAKTASASPLVVGASGQYYRISITVANGPTTAPLTIGDTLPTGITLAGQPTWSGSGSSLGDCANSSGGSIGPNCTLASGLANGTYTMEIPINVSSAAIAGGARNTANLGGGGDPACTAASTTDACDPSTGDVPAQRKADLSITKTSGQGTSYVPGKALNYTIVVTNNGPSNVAGATITDQVPADVTVSQWACAAGGSGTSCGPTASGSGNSVNLTGVDLPSGASVTITITGQARLGATGDIVNTAKVTPPDGWSCTSAPCEKSSSVTSTNSGTPALSVAKQATPSTFAVGQAGTYSIMVTNTGTTSTSGTITVADAMPAGITIASVSGDGWTCSATNGTSLSCSTAAVLQPGAAAPVILAEVNVGNDAATPAVNTASAIGGGTDCTAQAPCDVTIKTNIDRPQLDVSKVLNGSFVVGQPASYTITVANNGAAATLAGTITDEIPEGLVIGSLTGSGCSASGQTVTCEIPAGRPAGSTMSFTIAVTPQASVNGQSLVNKAQAQGDTGDSTCPDEAHCTGTTDNPVAAPQLSLTKASSVPAFTVGQGASYQLVVTNTGTAATTAGVTIKDTVPAGLTIDGASLTSGCSVVPEGSQTVVCTVASLEVNQSATFDIPVTPQPSVDGLTLINQATVTGGGDPLCADGAVASSLPERCAPQTSTVVDAPHLKVVKSTDVAEFSVGVAAHYVLTVTNVGSASTSGTITVRDRIPASLTLGDLPSGCTAQDQLVTCETTKVLAANDQGADSEVSFSIEVTPQAAASPRVSNHASVFGGGDPVCPMAQDCHSRITTNVSAPTLQLAKTSNGPWIAGQSGAIYTLTVGNASAAVASVGTITVFDSLPEGITAAGGTYGNWVCTVDGTGRGVSCESVSTLVIAAGGNDAIELPVTVALASGTSASVTNNASVAGGGDPFNAGVPPQPGSACAALDANQPGHCASTVTTVQTASSLAVSKSLELVNGASVPAGYAAGPGDVLTYAITVQNAGGAPGSAKLTETVPAGTSYAGSNEGWSTSPACQAAQSTCEQDVPVAGNGQATVRFTVQVAGTLQAGEIVNTVQGNGAACADCTVTTPVRQADMQAGASASGAGSIGTPVTITSTCTNNGPYPAVNATCELTLQGMPAGTVPQCAPALPVAELAVGTAITCTTRFTPTSAGVYSVQVTAGNQLPDPDMDNNSGSTVITVGSSTGGGTAPGATVAVPVDSKWWLLALGVSIALAAGLRRQRGRRAR